MRHILDVIADDAYVPTVSFTGGEPTLRPDLPELIAYAKKRRLRTNLITNGRRCAANGYVERLASAGLDSAQVSLEAADPAVHDVVVGRPGAWDATVRGLAHLKAAGIHVHTNTTINTLNRHHLLPLVDWLGDMGQPYLSMNMVIRTGTALDHAEDDMSYGEVGPIIRSVQAYAQEKGIEFIWYSPLPYCMFNPVQAGLGSKSCACVDGLISVNPAGGFNSYWPMPFRKSARRYSFRHSRGSTR